MQNRGPDSILASWQDVTVGFRPMAGPITEATALSVLGLNGSNGSNGDNGSSGRQQIGNVTDGRSCR